MKKLIIFSFLVIKMYKRQRQNTDINSILERLYLSDKNTITDELFQQVIDNKKEILNILDENSDLYKELDITNDYDIKMELHHDTSIYIEVKLGNTKIWCIDFQFGYNFYNISDNIFNNYANFLSLIMNNMYTTLPDLNIEYSPKDQGQTENILFFGDEIRIDDVESRIFYNHIIITDINRKRICEQLNRQFANIDILLKNKYAKLYN